METFIRAYDILDTTICEEIIEVHKHNRNSGPGLVGKVGSTNSGGEVDRTIKASTDSHIDLAHPISDCVAVALDTLGRCLGLYLKEFPDANNVGKFSIVEPISLQSYQPGEGYFARHCERASKGSCLRHLVFMIYLNTVTDSGGTAFPNQDLIVDAVAGRVVIWPSDWTHSHYGVVSPTQEKFIMTGWYSYL